MKLPKTLTEDEQAHLLGALCPHHQSYTRDKAIILCMLDGGMRVNEVCNLRVKFINWRNGKMKILGKGKKERFIYMTARLSSALKEWLESRPIEAEWCFYNLKNKKGKPITPRNIQQILKRLGDINPHALRHTFASDLLRKSKNLRLCQRALGHSSITTTTIYTHIVDEELEEAWKGLRE